MNTLRDLPYDLRQLVERELNADETTAWVGRPRPIRMAIKALPMALFAIPFTGFAVYWMYSASGFKMPNGGNGGVSFFSLFGVPFVIVGVGLLFSPLWKMRVAKRTVYAVTNKRAIVFEGGWGTSVRSFGPDQLQNMNRKQRSDGSGDIVFKKEMHGTRRHDAPAKEIGFLGIDDVKHAEEKIRAFAAVR